MNDTEIVNWMEDHLSCVRLTMLNDVEIIWIDEQGYEHKTVGSDLRDAVAGAVCWQTIDF